MHTPDLYFEIFDGGNLVRMESLQYSNDDAQLD